MWADCSRHYDRDAWLPILSDGDGHVAEGPGLNVFAVKEGRLYTPARGVLEGITRLTAIEIARDKAWDLCIRDVPVTVLYEAQELFLTSTAGGIMPVATLDGQPVGTGAQGRITRAIRDRYCDLHFDSHYTIEVEHGASA